MSRRSVWAVVASHWYPILLVVAAIPLSWLGAKIFELQASRGIQQAKAQ